MKISYPTPGVLRLICKDVNCKLFLGERINKGIKNGEYM